MKLKLFIVSILFVLNVSGQTNDSLEVVICPQKYFKELIQVLKYYDHLDDSLTMDFFKKVSEDSLYSEKEAKNRPKKYRGYDGGLQGYLMEEKSQKLKKIVLRFLKIESFTLFETNQDKTEFKLYYKRIERNPDKSQRLIDGYVYYSQKKVEYFNSEISL